MPGASGPSQECNVLSICGRRRGRRVSAMPQVPETAPFSPAWKGTRTTVERALRMIQGGALDEESVETLAVRLGIGARHLGRLFQRHIGASPAGRENNPSSACQAPTRRDPSADDRDCDAREVWETASLQCSFRGGLQTPSDGGSSRVEKLSMTEGRPCSKRNKTPKQPVRGSE